MDNQRRFSPLIIFQHLVNIQGYAVMFLGLAKLQIYLIALWKYLLQNLLSISDKEVKFTQRRFFAHSHPHVKQRLELIGKVFLQGYHAALASENIEQLELQLKTIPIEEEGFAFEGAAMGLALLDRLIPGRRNRVQQLLATRGSDHIYMVHVGVGWIIARLHPPIEQFLNQLDPLLKWLAIDGYGFHQGYFCTEKYIRQPRIPHDLSGYALRAFDQGLGRSIWFADGGDVKQIVQTIVQFPSNRQGDLWSGIGLACTYAGGVEADTIKALMNSAQSYRPQLAQGAVFAAKVRQRASNWTAHTEIACQILCGLSANAAAEIADTTLEALPNKETTPAYEIWRQRIQHHFAISEVKV